MPREVTVPISHLSMGGFLRWLSTTIEYGECRKEMERRAKLADQLIAALTEEHSPCRQSKCRVCEVLKDMGEM